jgi:TPR repeat protein
MSGPPTLIAFVLVLATFPARADLYSAQVAYKKGDFATAFQQFKELAELGQPKAQLDLAVMYARGEGVNESKETRAGLDVDAATPATDAGVEAAAGAAMSASAAPAADVAPDGGMVGAGTPCAPSEAILEAWAAACLHLSDSESLFCLRQARIRPPPDCTLEQNFRASSAQPA